MSVESIDGHVLLAHPADWAEPPKWSLAWDTEVASTLRGNEGRSALREMPRPTLEYSVQPMTTAAQARLVSALLVGLASGRCCAPLFGRASWLAADAAAGATALTIEPSPWRWQAGDWLLIYSADGGHQVRQVGAINAAGTGFTVAALGGACSAESAVYPLFFGRPEVEDITQLTGERSTVPIRLVGDEFEIAAAVPGCCLEPTDFAVIRVAWLPTSGDDLDLHVGLVQPPGLGTVGYGTPTPTQVPVYPATPFLRWGQDQNGQQFETVLVDFRQLRAVYPDAAQFVAQMQGNWFGDQGFVGDGHVQMEIRTWRGGVMQGPVAHDFVNVGGQPGQMFAASFTVVRLQNKNFGQLAYNPVSKTVALLPP